MYSSTLKVLNLVDIVFFFLSKHTFFLISKKQKFHSTLRIRHCALKREHLATGRLFNWTIRGLGREEVQPATATMSALRRRRRGRRRHSVSGVYTYNWRAVLSINWVRVRRMREREEKRKAGLAW